MLFPLMSIEKKASHVLIALVRILMNWVHSLTAIALKCLPMQFRESKKSIMQPYKF